VQLLRRDAEMNCSKDFNPESVAKLADHLLDEVGEFLQTNEMNADEIGEALGIVRASAAN
jgi:hypothetical protein